MQKMVDSIRYNRSVTFAVTVDNKLLMVFVCTTKHISTHLWTKRALQGLN